MTITMLVHETAPHSDLEAVDRGLVDHAVESGIEPRDFRGLTVFARDERGNLIGGLVGDTVWGWLLVRRLWVAPAHRGQGHGRRLLEAAEAEARRRGCHGSQLDTFDFQAREFYERLGYVVFGTVADFPRGHVRSFLTKALDGSAP